MDKISGLGTGAYLKFRVATVFFSFLTLFSSVACSDEQASVAQPDAPSVKDAQPTDAQPTQEQRPAWAQQLEEQLKNIDEAHLGELGVYVKDLATGESVSLRGEESWYLASGVKVPVAIAVLRNIEMGEFSLDTEVHLVETDYVDGAGETNWHGPGSRLTVGFLMEQMITRSDNTATDMLIRLVGLKQVNSLLRELVPDGFGEITTLADVRRHAYSGFHPGAFRLRGRDFFVLKKQREERKRIEALAGVLGVSADDFAMTDMDSAFAAYYATNLNGGTLTAYGKLLQSIVRGEALRPESTEYLLGLLKSVKTGDLRIKAELPQSVSFAHKTGTQHLRVCDLGVTLGKEDRGDQSPRVVITACNRGFASLSAAEATLRAVGKAVAASGVLELSETRNVAQKMP